MNPIFIELMDNINILIVDDTPANLHLLGKILKQQGYTVYLAPEGSMALDLARKALPDLILLDIIMPGMDGFEVCEKLKADDHTRDIPVIFISALQETSDKLKAFSMGGVDYIDKPFQPKEVLARVQTHLKLRNLQRSLEAQNSILMETNRQLKKEIADRIRAEEALIRSEALHRIVLSSISDAVFISDEKGQITFICPNVETIFGYPYEEAIQFENISRFLEDLHFNEDLLNRTGELRNIDHEIVDKHGTRHHLLINIKRVSIQGGTILYTCRDITERKAIENELAVYQEKLRSLHSEMLIIEERERRKISMELHDDIGQKLALLKMKFGQLKEKVHLSHLSGMFHDLSDLTEQIIQSTRSLMFETSPSILYELGFDAAIEWLIENFEDQHHLRVESHIQEDLGKMDERVMYLLFRIIRELLMNIVKHAQTLSASLALFKNTSCFKIIVKDYGVGFDTSKLNNDLPVNQGFGLFSIRERLKDLGGQMDIESEPGKGTCVTLQIPLTT